MCWVFIVVYLGVMHFLANRGWWGAMAIWGLVAGYYAMSKFPAVFH